MLFQAAIFQAAIFQAMLQSYLYALINRKAEQSHDLLILGFVLCRTKDVIRHCGNVGHLGHVVEHLEGTHCQSSAGVLGQVVVLKHVLRPVAGTLEIWEDRGRLHKCPGKSYK